MPKGEWRVQQAGQLDPRSCACRSGDRIAIARAHEADGQRVIVTSTAALAAQLPSLTSGERELRSPFVAVGDAARERIELTSTMALSNDLGRWQCGSTGSDQEFYERGDHEFSAVLYAFGRQVEEAIDELRELAHGVDPPLLADCGLSAALTAPGRHAAQRAAESQRGSGGYPREVESAVYFSCVTGMRNAARHAGATEVAVRVWETGDVLRFSVLNTGRGFDPQHVCAGARITNMPDRLDAVGGGLTIDSAPSQETRVLGAVPTPGSASD